MKIKEFRRIDGGTVREMCIRNDYYTMGTSREYENLLMNLCGGMYQGVEATTEVIQKIAEDIFQHSDEEAYNRKYGGGMFESIAFELLNECCTIHVEIEK